MSRKELNVCCLMAFIIVIIDVRNISYLSEYSVPGPNIYTLPDTFQDAPKYSMTYRAFEVNEGNSLFFTSKYARKVKTIFRKM